MKTFEYVATRPDGSQTTGRAWATSELELDNDLEQRGLVLTTAKVIANDKTRRKLKLKPEQLIHMTNQLATVTSAGVPLVDGLKGLKQRASDPSMEAILDEMISSLEAGSSLSQAMERHPGAFPEIYRASVHAGEKSGALDAVLIRLSKYLEWTRTIRSTALQAMVYPCILLTAVLVLLVVLLYFVLPRILDLLPGGRDSLPSQTKIVMGISEFLTNNALFLGVGLAIGVVILRSAIRRPNGRHAWHKFLLNIPKFGTIARKLATSRFSSTASTLQSAGCDMFTVLEVSGRTCGNAAMASCFSRIRDRVRRGMSLTESTEREPILDPLLNQMISVGEKTGELDHCLGRLVDYYDVEIPRDVKKFLAFLEPAILAVAGVAVAYILMAALLPMFSLYENMS